MDISKTHKTTGATTDIVAEEDRVTEAEAEVEVVALTTLMLEDGAMKTSLSPLNRTPGTRHRKELQTWLHNDGLSQRMKTGTTPQWSRE